MSTAPTASATKAKDPLAAAKIDKAGAPVANPREQVVTLVAAAKERFSSGVPEGAVFYGMPRDRMHAAANGYNLGSLVSLVSDEELRLLLHAAHVDRQASMMPPGHHQGEGFRGPIAASTPGPSDSSTHAEPPSSPAKRWRVVHGKRCSLNGQLFWVERGSIIRENDYGTGDVQKMVGAGLVLEAIE